MTSLSDNCFRYNGVSGFVNADVPYNAVAVGVPAKVIRTLRKEEIMDLNMMLE